MSKRLEKKENRILAVAGRIWTWYINWWDRQRKWPRAVYIAVTTVLILGVSAAFAVSLWVRPPAPVDIIVNPPAPSPADILPSGAPLTPVPSGEEPAEELGYVRREGVYTFLLAGINEGMTDTLMVATLDTVQGTCHVLSIPRDTAVERAPRTIRKINSAYSQQRNTWDDEPGIPQLKKEIATLTGFQPQYSAVVNYNAFRRLVAAIGGVEFNVPMRMYVPAEGIDLQRGRQHLNADQALQLVRFRYDPVTGAGYDDYGRMKMQQEFLAAAARKALGNWTNIPEYIRIAQSNVESDVDWGNLIWFADQVNRIGIDNVVFSTLPTVTVHRPAEIVGTYYEAVIAEEALELINQTINPFIIPIGEELVEYIALTERR